MAKPSVPVLGTGHCKAEKNEMTFQTLYRLISNECPNLNIADVAECLEAYGNVMTYSIQNGFTVPFPRVGKFTSKILKGFEGGMVYYPDKTLEPDPITGIRPRASKYKDPQPDCLIPMFTYHLGYRTDFKSSTRGKL